MNKQGPTVINARIWANWRQWKTVETKWVDDTWGPARPLSAPTLRERLVIAWKVFTGEYDAMTWRGLEND